MLLTLDLAWCPTPALGFMSAWRKGKPLVLRSSVPGFPFNLVSTMLFPVDGRNPAIFCWYSQGNRIIPGFLGWCEMDFGHPQYDVVHDVHQRVPH